jgi:hypothetical protein
MPISSSSQRIAEISKEVEALRAQSLSHPYKAAEMIQDGLGKIQVSLKELTVSAGGGGMVERKRGERKCIIRRQSLQRNPLLDSVPKSM